jgi:hypothetical protein
VAKDNGNGKAGQKLKAYTSWIPPRYKSLDLWPRNIWRRLISTSATNVIMSMLPQGMLKLTIE